MMHSILGLVGELIGDWFVDSTHARAAGERSVARIVLVMFTIPVVGAVVYWLHISGQIG